MPSVLSKWHGNPWAILITLSLGFFMTLLDLTIVNIAIPIIVLVVIVVVDFHVNFATAATK